MLLRVSNFSLLIDNTNKVLKDLWNNVIWMQFKFSLKMLNSTCETNAIKLSNTFLPKCICSIVRKKIKIVPFQKGMLKSLINKSTISLIFSMRSQCPQKKRLFCCSHSDSYLFPRVCCLLNKYNSITFISLKTERKWQDSMENHWQITIKCKHRSYFLASKM